MRRAARLAAAGAACYSAGVLTSEHVKAWVSLEVAADRARALLGVGGSAAPGAKVEDRILASAQALLQWQHRFPSKNCVLATKRGNSVTARPVNVYVHDLVPAHPGGLPDFRFVTSRNCRKVGELAAWSECVLVFTEPSATGLGYVKVRGEAKMLCPEEAVATWLPEMQQFYPQGHEGGKGQYCVFRMRPTRMEHWAIHADAGHSDGRPLALNWDSKAGRWVANPAHLAESGQWARD